MNFDSGTPNAAALFRAMRKGHEMNNNPQTPAAQSVEEKLEYVREHIARRDVCEQAMSGIPDPVAWVEEVKEITHKLAHHLLLNDERRSLVNDLYAVVFPQPQDNQERK